MSNNKITINFLINFVSNYVMAFRSISESSLSISFTSFLGVEIITLIHDNFEVVVLLIYFNTNMDINFCVSEF